MGVPQGHTHTLHSQQPALLWMQRWRLQELSSGPTRPMQRGGPSLRRTTGHSRAAIPSPTTNQVFSTKPSASPRLLSRPVPTMQTLPIPSPTSSSKEAPPRTELNSWKNGPGTTTAELPSMSTWPGTTASSSYPKAITTRSWTSTTAVFNRPLPQGTVEPSPTPRPLVWRMMLYSDTVPQIDWKALCSLAEPSISTEGTAYRDVHAALAFAGANDWEKMTALLDRFQARAASGDTLASEIMVPLMKGLQLFAHERTQESLELLEPLFGPAVMDQLARVGGSHAQREVLEDTLVACFLETEQFDKAKSMLSTRLSRRPSPRDLFWLARAKTGLGDSDAAQLDLTQGRPRMDRLQPRPRLPGARPSPRLCSKPPLAHPLPGPEHPHNVPQHL